MLNECSKHSFEKFIHAVIHIVGFNDIGGDVSSAIGSYINMNMLVHYHRNNSNTYVHLYKQSSTNTDIGNVTNIVYDV